MCVQKLLEKSDFRAPAEDAISHTSASIDRGLSPFRLNDLYDLNDRLHFVTLTNYKIPTFCLPSAVSPGKLLFAPDIQAVAGSHV